MIEKLKELHQLRLKQAELDAEKKGRYAKYLAENNALFVQIEALENLMGELSAGIRQEAIKAFQETGNKAPWPWVGIRELPKLRYDPKEALAWAQEHKIALALDTRKFEALAKGGDISFVEIAIMPQATIAQDLGPYVQEPDV